MDPSRKMIWKWRWVAFKAEVLCKVLGHREMDAPQGWTYCKRCAKIKGLDFSWE